MLSLFAYLIYLREQLPPIPDSTWMDRTIILSISMVFVVLSQVRSNRKAMNHFTL